jgi:D-3-phosphoglycerate dehydrogenase / 2-oxoglutarate reductase
MRGLPRPSFPRPRESGGKWVSRISQDFRIFQDFSISGTVFAKEELRIVDFFGYKLDFEPAPYVIAIQNIDMPGTIGRVGTLLGANGINIAAMQWSRNRKGEKAISFVSVDGEVSDAVLIQLSRLEGVLKASMLRL